MTRTLDNGIIVPVNSDDFRPTAQIAEMGNSTNTVLKVASKLERDELPALNGWTCIRQDLAGAPIETFDGTRWSVSDTPETRITPYSPQGFSHYTEAGKWNGLNYEVRGGWVFINGALTRSSSWTANTVCATVPTALRPTWRVEGTGIQVDNSTGFIILLASHAAGAVSMSAAYPVPKG